MGASIQMADNPIKNRKPEQAYITWGSEEERVEALNQVSDTVESYDGVMRATASHRSFLDVETNRSVRSDFIRDDYYRFRRHEAIPKKPKDIIGMCMSAYESVGIIKNVIDLMGDFASQGISIVHPNPKIERFYKKWFNKINGKERSERFLNVFYRCGNVVVKRRTAKISRRFEESLKRASAADLSVKDVKTRKKEIPWIYDFLNPLTIEVIGDELAVFAGKPKYAMRVTKGTSKLIKRAYESDSKHKDSIKSLPSDLVEKINRGETLIPLDPDKVRVFFYKKDDWSLWSNPMIYAILDDIIMLEKMKLADMSALDGAISNIRLWQLGDIDNKILPTKSAINKLRNILASNVGGGTMDLVWGPELNFVESNSQVFRFLGSEKYGPVLSSIYAGLGIPPTLTGSASSSGGGFTNNFVSLKTLIERLEYGRNVLLSFWNEEIEIIQKAMGFRFPARIKFDQMALADEAAEKNLLIQLVDRDIVSVETVLERFGEIPEIEKIRIKRESKNRQVELSPPKASPYHNPQHRQDLEKIAMSKDAMSPAELGLRPSDETGMHPLTTPSDRPESKEQERKYTEPPEQQPKQNSPTGRPEDGRPKFSQDKQKRKQKRVLPDIKADSDLASIFMWTNKAQQKISETVNPAMLSFYNKKNLRGLTKSELETLEHIKFGILSNLNPFDDITVSLIESVLNNNTPVNSRVEEAFSALMDDEELDTSIDNIRGLRVLAFIVANN